MRIIIYIICFALLIFSNISLADNIIVHKDLKIIINNTHNICGYKIISMYRDKETQNELYRMGKTKLKFPHSKHNVIPVQAFDFIPLYYNHNPYDYSTDFYWIAGCIYYATKQLKKDGKITHSIRWGGDWDMDNNFHDQKFNDLGHIELH
jgi:peptidoglycan L-alanyl-D-glutamate endopeptidase CwlK